QRRHRGRRPPRARPRRRPALPRGACGEPRRERARARALRRCGARGRRPGPHHDDLLLAPRARARGIRGLRRRARRGRARARAAALGALALATLAAVPAFRTALAPAAAFLAREDRWGSANVEQRPLFRWLARGPVARGRPATALYGGFAWLIPLAPLAALAAARDPRRPLAALPAARLTPPLRAAP